MLILVILLALLGLGLVWWLRARSVQRRRNQAMRDDDSNLGNPF